MKALVLYIIRFYQKFLSFDTGFLKLLVFSQPVCRYSPSCSQYTYNAVEKHGTAKGIFLGIKRILSCSSLGNFQSETAN